MPSKPGDKETSRTIIVRVTMDTHRALRIRVAEEDTSIQKWVENLVERELGVVDADTPPQRLGGRRGRR